MIILNQAKRGRSKGETVIREWRISIDKIIGYFSLEHTGNHGGNTFVFLPGYEMYVKETVAEIDSMIQEEFKLKKIGA